MNRFVLSMIKFYIAVYWAVIACNLVFDQMNRWIGFGVGVGMDWMDRLCCLL